MLPQFKKRLSPNAATFYDTVVGVCLEIQHVNWRMGVQGGGDPHKSARNNG